jgi:D-alanyl-D-alanine carboxypeptidase
MSRSPRFVLGFLAVQACSSPDGAVDADDGNADAPLPAASRVDLEQTLARVVAEGVAPGVALTVARPGYAVWSGAAGVADLESGAALLPVQRFRAGSLLKTGVAVAVLQLVEAGALSLDDQLTRLVPSAMAARIPGADAITLRMLLGHTSGLSDFATPEFDVAVASDPTRVWTVDELLGHALEQGMVFPPGTGWSYANTGYILLGEVLSRTTGKPWRTVVRERVFARAKLAQSTLPEEGNPLCEGCARGYLPTEHQLVDVTEIDPSMAGAAGGEALVTTTDDLVRLHSALGAGALFDDPATLALMLDFTDAPVPEEAQSGYGLGLARFQVGDLELIGHLGGTAGFHGFAFTHPGTGTIASGFMNQNGDFAAFVLPVLDALARLP